VGGEKKRKGAAGGSVNKEKELTQDVKRKKKCGFLSVHSYGGPFRGEIENERDLSFPSSCPERRRG